MKKKRRKKKKCLAKIPELSEFRRCKNNKAGAKYCRRHKNWKKKIGKKFQCIEKMGRKRCPNTAEPGSGHCLSHQNNNITTKDIQIEKGT